ncbi:hypothetical protein GCM10007870_14780 [Gluconobacter kondonii]|uniref:Transposase n=1 Tax=Gluconobacter kondonii TaxID=941463 RepID=A0ABQ5WTB3_9PROT|nr:hypothetical protein GCM10007870_14780 [Gluconobacter kondonii]
METPDSVEICAVMFWAMEYIAGLSDAVLTDLPVETAFSVWVRSAVVWFRLWSAAIAAVFVLIDNDIESVLRRCRFAASG